jgi:extracellular factor (EF) 3-hydroxypalmitic acid methyl ester biosynthesis protein
MPRSEKIILFPETVSGVVEPRRPKRMRTRRLKVQDLKLGPIDVAFRHAELGEVVAVAEDLSVHGLAAALPRPSGSGSVVLAGDRLEGVSISCRAGVLYRGNALVRRVAERVDDIVLGLELDAAGIDLGQLHRSGTRLDFTNRWEAVKRDADYGHISPAFKAWVADLRAELASTQRFLDSEEQSLAAEDRATREQARREYLAVVVPDLLERLTAARDVLASMVGRLTEREHAEYRAYCALQLRPFLTQSPFLRRALEKPLGYAGDYEMMNMLYRDPIEGETLLGQALNVCFTTEPAAEANKNRIAYIGQLIRVALAEHRGRVRIASLGCGPSREIEALLTSSPELGGRLDIALIDQEERAIAQCERTLAPLAAKTGARIKFIRESLRTLLTRDLLSEKLGQRELIYSAGLFDYLDDRMFSRITSVLYEALSEGGRLAIGNVAAHNPSRWVMEYFSEWFLIHRSAEQLKALAGGLTPRPRRLDVDAEPSGVNLFLLIRR